jgi:hypothetical protein
MEVSRARVYKRELRIGLLPDKMIVEFFEFFIKNMPFYDKNRKIHSIAISDDKTSMLR